MITLWLSFGFNQIPFILKCPVLISFTSHIVFHLWHFTIKMRVYLLSRIPFYFILNCLDAAQQQLLYCFLQSSFLVQFELRKPSSSLMSIYKFVNFPMKTTDYNEKWWKTDLTFNVWSSKVYGTELDSKRRCETVCVVRW